MEATKRTRSSSAVDWPDWSQRLSCSTTASASCWSSAAAVNASGPGADVVRRHLSGRLARAGTRYPVETICRQPKKYSWQILNWKIAAKELAVSGSEFNPAIRDKKLVREFVTSCEDFVTANSIEELSERMNALAGNRDVNAARRF
jgi:hypothetical protein